MFNIYDIVDDRFDYSTESYFYLKRDERKNQLLTWRKIGFP
tara:strand:- start:13 stop:135 length:123 start_codon:yes stop_codon:yes gene_type:complete